jgi:hypothetical protein
MAKCDLCKSQIEETFLDKIKGTYITVKGKKKTICNNCQKTFSNEEILEKLK